MRHTEVMIAGLSEPDRARLAVTAAVTALELARKQAKQDLAKLAIALGLDDEPGDET